MTRHTLVGARIALAAVLSLVLAGRAPCGAPKEPSPAEIRKIRAAAPTKATARPKKRRRVLVFSHSPGYKHSSIPCTAAAIRILGEKTGAYEAVLNDDISMFEPRNLRGFDAVVMNNTCGIRDLDREIFLPANLKKLPAAEQREWRARDAALKKSFSEFVRGGGGLVGIHGATGAFSKWPEYGQMMGGYFKSHPWNQKVTVKLDDPAHPLLAAFGGEPFVIKEETYEVREPYSRELVRVLLTLDTDSVDAKKGSRRDGDYALAWIKRHGEGRVFYGAFSHYNETFYNTKLLRFYLDGIQWALGDLEADATPSAARRAGAPVPDDLFAKIAAYRAGQSRKPLIELERLVRESHGNAEARAGLRGRLVSLVGAAAATRDGRAFACLELSLIATPDDVPALARLLSDKDLHHAARSALERIPGREATAALRDALSALEGDLLVGAVNSLGRRRDPAASRALARLLGGDDAAAAEAAVRALGRIGGPGAARALVAAKGKLPGKAAAAWTDAFLSCADSRLAAGSALRAGIMYRMMAGKSMPSRVRFAALRGLVSADPGGSVSLVVEALRDDDAGMQRMATRLVAEVPGEAATKAFARALDGLPPAAQASLIAALAERGDVAAGPAVARAAGSRDSAVRLAALKALGKVGDASAVPGLVEKAAGASGDEQRAARDALAGLRGEGVDAALIEDVTGAKPAECAVAVRALAARRAQGVVPTLMKSARGADASVRVESLKALGMLAEGGDTGALIGLLVKAEDASERREAERAVAAASARLPEGADRARPVVDALASAPPAARPPLIRILGRVGGGAALDAVRAALKGGDEEGRATALRVLAEWPSPEPAGDLLAIAKGAADPADGIIALRGYVRMAGLAGVGTSDRLAMYEKAMAAATRNEERKLVLAGVGSVAMVEALAFAQRRLGDAALGTEAAAACIRIASAVAGKHRAEARAALREALEAIPNDKANGHLRQDAEKVLKLSGG